MSKIGTSVKVCALAGALALSTQTFAASTFSVPINYSVELVDGKTSDFGYSRNDRTLTLSPGRHQIVLLFEGSFGAARDSRLIQAANPIVVEIADMPDNAHYTFTYNTPRTERDAELYARSQKINLIDGNSKAPLSSAQADYYILTSDSGFAILRDYRDDLASVGRLYAPNPVEKAAADQAAVNVRNANGVTTVQAKSAVAAAATAGAGVHAVKPEESKTVQASSAGISTYENLVNLYESADDSTKLKFVKYIMSH